MIQNFTDIVANKYAQCTGRANRAEFWQYVLVYATISVAITLCMLLSKNIMSLKMLCALLQGLIFLALLLPSIALGVRRMHDIGKGGEWVLITILYR